MSVVVHTEPKVDLIQAPYYKLGAMNSHGHVLEMDAGDAEVVPIFAGRACYQSFGDKAGRKTAAEYLGNIMDQRHFSILEHSSLSFYITGVSRTFTHELVRHRIASYSELSQRYVGFEDELHIVVPPALRDNTSAIEYLRTRAEEDQKNYLFLLNVLHSDGLSRKEARQAARCLLPGCTETRIVVTMNLRAWYEFLTKRDHPAADAEMQEVAKLIKRQCQHFAPNVFGPLEDDGE